MYYGDVGATFDGPAWLKNASLLSDLGWQVTLVTGPSPVPEADPRVSLWRLPRPNVFAWRWVRYNAALLWRCVRARPRPDVLLFHGDAAPFLFLPRLLFIWRRSCPPKLVMDTRSLVMHPPGWRRVLWVSLARVSQCLAKLLADGQTAITRRMAEEVRIPPAKLLGLWPSGVEVERFAPARNLRKWPGPQDTLRLVYVGTLMVERNVITACKAVRLVRNEGLQVSLDLVGDGNGAEELKRFAAEYPAAGVTFRGPVAPGAVPQVLAEAHVGILPFPDLPKFRVSSFIKLLEYMAAGMPVLATRIVAHSDVIQDRDFVFWAEDARVEGLADAIRGAWARRQDLKAMGDLAAGAGNDWTYTAVASKLDACLRRVLPPAGNGPGL